MFFFVFFVCLFVFFFLEMKNLRADETERFCYLYNNCHTWDIHTHTRNRIWVYTHIEPHFASIKTWNWGWPQQATKHLQWTTWQTLHMTQTKIVNSTKWQRTNRKKWTFHQLICTHIILKCIELNKTNLSLFVFCCFLLFFFCFLFFSFSFLPTMMTPRKGRNIKGHVLLLLLLLLFIYLFIFRW